MIEYYRYQFSSMDRVILQRVDSNPRNSTGNHSLDTSQTRQTTSNLPESAISIQLLPSPILSPLPGPAVTRYDGRPPTRWTCSSATITGYYFDVSWGFLANSRHSKPVCEVSIYGPQLPPFSIIVLQSPKPPTQVPQLHSLAELQSALFPRNAVHQHRRRRCLQPSWDPLAPFAR